MLGAGRHAQLLAAVERRHLDVGAADRLGDRQRHLDLEVVALALEDRRRRDVGDDVQVAGRPAVAARLALARQPDPRALAHARGDVHLVVLDRLLLAGAMAGRARVLDDRARSVAARARLGDREEPLALGLDPAALALRADLRRRAGLGARAAAGRTRLRRRDAQRDLRAGDRLLEGDRDRRLQVGAALGARTGRAAAGAPARAGTARGATAAAAEQVGEDVLEATEVARGEPAGRAARAATAAHPEHAAAVELLALLGVADDVVGRLDLLEALLGLGVARVVVRVVLADELAVRLLDLLLGRLLVDPEDLVGVGRRHAATTTLAARRISSL